MGFIYAAVTVLAWGTWLAPSQDVPLRRQETRMFYVTSANLIITLLVAAIRGIGALNWEEFWAPFTGGLVWSVSSLCAFTASSRLGIAKAFGIWSPLNIMVSLACGAVHFGEFRGLTATRALLLAACVVAMIAGVLMIVLVKPHTAAATKQQGGLAGLAAAAAAGILWGIYYIPVKASGASLWIAAFPLAVGMFCGSGALMLVSRANLRLERGAHHIRLLATGVLWTIGNYGMLLLVDTMGAGRGYTFSQLSVVVNAIVGIYFLNEPPPATRAARLTLLGCGIATTAAILLGQIK